jgi:TRAP-type C4-dicarboxylate transport system permease small subunit
VMFAVALVALYYSFETVMVSAHFGSVTDGLRVSKVWFLMAVPLGFALIVWRLLQSFVRDFRSLKNGTPVYQGDTLFD